MSKNGKLFGIINLLDLLILIVIILGLAVGYRFFNKKKAETTGETRFVVEFRNMEKGFADKISVGDPVKDSIKDEKLGVITNVEAVPEFSINWNIETREFVKVESPERYIVYVEIKSSGSADERDIFAESYPIKVGKDMAIKGKGYAQSGYCVGVNYSKGEDE